MKNLSNRYFYEVHYSVDDNGNIHRWNGDVYADRNNRLYKTKMKPNDLPEYYCEVQRYGNRYDIINASGVVDIAYSWGKENHFTTPFMKVGTIPSLKCIRKSGRRSR